MLSYPATWLLSRGFMTERKPLSGHPSVVPFQFFATADGYLAIAAPKEKFFGTLVEMMGLAELRGDPRFADFEGRDRHRDELLAILGGRFAERTTEAWVALLRGSVPVAPVRSLAEATDPDELRDRAMLAEYEHPSFGPVRSIGLPLTFGGFEPTYRPGPALDGDGPSIVRDLGYDDTEIDRLRADGAFGATNQANPAAIEPG